jgi:hypothetical protein
MIQELLLISELLRGQASSTPSRNGSQCPVSRPGLFDSWRKDRVITTSATTTPEPIKAKTFGESLTALTYPEGWDPTQIVVNLDPADVAAFKEQEKIKRALR